MNSKPLQVWLVDDDASIRWVLEKALKGSGMSAKCFDQADNVITALRSGAPDVLMTDIRMPGRSGLDLLKCPGGRLAGPAGRLGALDGDAQTGVGLSSIVDVKNLRHGRV